VACSNVASNGELFPRVRFIVTNLGRPAKWVVRGMRGFVGVSVHFYNQLIIK
jgi:hypothetical protein